MPIFQLTAEPVFPPVALAEPEGILAVGGDLSLRRLLTAYSEGIFPWYSRGEPILWWSPDPRLVLDPHGLHIPKSLAKTMRKTPFSITCDRAFPQVIRACGQLRQKNGTWITHDLEKAFIQLHRLGLAHSVEAWGMGENAQPILVGGLYGLALGGIFFGESMFHVRPEASKIALVHLARQLQARGFTLIDCQMKTDHLLRFGAYEIPRALFLTRLQEALRLPIPAGLWH
ncbi:MAG: leucyl/phenylalanyl-tRNA--protein transferase [Magnetococcales bacterium]|nr:leucyl/phenylalanyl-tRNA--protein transferase [Magnetococcales bacterium]